MNIKSYELSAGDKSLVSKDLFPDIDIKNDSDDILSRKIDLRIEEAKPLHDAVCKVAEDSVNLFRGDLEKVNDAVANKYKSKTVLSRIFFTIRNLVGLATDSMPFVEIIPDNDNPKSIKRAKNIESNVEWNMLETDFQGKLSMALFEAWIKSDGFFTWFWNYEKDDFDVAVVLMEDLSVSPEATTIQDAEFVIYHPYRSRAWWKTNYPDAYATGKIKFVNKTPDGVSNVLSSTKERGNVAQFIQYWENDILVEKVRSTEGDDIILKKSANPYFEYRTEEEQQLAFQKSNPQPTFLNKAVGFVKNAMGMGAPQQDPNIQDPNAVEFVPIKNYFVTARKPFVQLPSIKIAGEFYSEKVVQQVREVFLSMNEKKRAYADNLAGCNQKVVVDSNAFSKQEADKITSEPMQVLRADFTDNSRPVYIERGSDVPASFHNDIAHDEQYIDDSFGSHDISRGTGRSGTLGQDQMNAQSDRTPIRFQSRATERAIVELTEGFLQMMRMFYTKTHYIKKWGRREGMEVIDLINSDIEDGVKPHIKPGSMITVSREEKASRATQLFAQGALDPYTMFVELDMPNPAELADRLVNWLKFQMISGDDPEAIMADQNGSDPMLQSVERANQENEGFQMGDNIPPTPPEYVTEDHVKTHYAFLSDKTKKMDSNDEDMLRAHADVDKATLTRVMASRIMKEKKQGSAQQAQQQQTTTAPNA